MYFLHNIHENMTDNHQQKLVKLLANSFQLQTIRFNRGNPNKIITITTVLNSSMPD